MPVIDIPGDPAAASEFSPASAKPGAAPRRNSLGGDLASDGPPVPSSGRSNGTFISGQAWITEVDKVAVEFEAYWGCGRLRLLVGPELRERFDRQRYLLNRAIWHSDLETVRTECRRMLNGWRVLDEAARASGATPLAPATLLEVSLKDGTVVIVVENSDQARLVKPDGRSLSVWTADEIANVLSAYRIAPRPILDGERVSPVRRTLGDPLDQVDARDELIIGGDSIPF